MIGLKYTVEISLSGENQAHWQKVYEQSRCFANQLGLRDIKKGQKGKADYYYADEINNFSVENTKGWCACYSTKTGRRIKDFILYEDLKVYSNGILSFEDIEDKDVLSLILFIESRIGSKQENDSQILMKHYPLYKEEFNNFMKMNEFAKTLFFVFSFKDIVLQKSIWDFIFNELSNKENIEPFYILAKIDKSKKDIYEPCVSLLSNYDKLLACWKAIK